VYTRYIRLFTLEPKGGHIGLSTHTGTVHLVVYTTLVHLVVYTGTYRWRHSVGYTGAFACVHWYILRSCTLEPIGGDIRLCTLVHQVVYTDACCNIHCGEIRLCTLLVHLWLCTLVHSVVYTGTFIRSCTLEQIGGDFDCVHWYIRLCTLVYPR
jgi:hypothetical protein